MSKKMGRLAAEFRDIDLALHMIAALPEDLHDVASDAYRIRHGEMQNSAEKTALKALRRKEQAEARLRKKDRQPTGEVWWWNTPEKRYLYDRILVSRTADDAVSQKEQWRRIWCPLPKKIAYGDHEIGRRAAEHHLRHTRRSSQRSQIYLCRCGSLHVGRATKRDLDDA